MPSKLVGLFRSLTWDEFPTVQEALPSSVRVAAFTSASIATDARPELIPKSKPVQFRLADSVTITAAFDKNRSFKKSWIAQLPQTEQDELLHHEQGHYDLNALLARDFFLALMALKEKTYKAQTGLFTDIGSLQKSIADKSQPVQKKYDDDTQAGADKTEQARWDKAIQAAFNTPVSPPRMTPDNTPIKIPLLTALSQAGISV